MLCAKSQVSNWPDFFVCFLVRFRFFPNFTPSLVLKLNRPFFYEPSTLVRRKQTVGQRADRRLLIFGYRPVVFRRFAYVHFWRNPDWCRFCGVLQCRTHARRGVIVHLFWRDSSQTCPSSLEEGTFFCGSLALQPQGMAIKTLMPTLF